MDIDLDKISKENSKSNFFYSFAFLPKRKQYAINTVYAYCQISDEIADTDLPIEVKKSNMDEWKRELSLSFETKSNFKLLNETASVAAEFSIPRSLFFELLEGMDMDLNNRRYDTFADLEKYCYKVASVVGLMTSKIFGYKHHETEQYAITLGKALQLTNILRDVKNDSIMGRIYLPKDDMERYSVTDSDIKDERLTDNLIQLLGHYYDKALNYYRTAEAIINPEDRRNFRVARIMKNIYFAILQKIEAQNFDVFKGNFKLSKFEKIKIALKTFIFDR